VSGFSVETRSLTGAVTAIGAAGPFTLVVDRPQEAGGGGKGFNGGQLLHLAVAGCVSNDLFREAPGLGVELHSVRITVDGDFAGEPPVSTPISYSVEVISPSDPERVRELIALVDRIAEIPNSLRQATAVRLGDVPVERP
jgi:putative redox protein